MSNRAAISGVFSDYRLVKTRGVLQLIVEVPVERQEQAFEALGFPVPGEDIHVALARLATKPEADEPEPAPSTRSTVGKARYMAAGDREKAVVRAATLPKNEKFRLWCKVRSEDGAIQFIRRRCGVNSRAEILTSDDAFNRFIAMETDYLISTNQLAEPR